MPVLCFLIAELLLSAFCFGQSGWKCSSENFKCGTDKCIPKTWQCDGEDDCGDNSDEKGCEANSCSVNQFRCDSGKCIRNSWLCDGDNDCNDNSDEKSCESKNMTCSTEQFTCKSKWKCIPKAWRCDHDNDCGDNSDEEDCRHSSCSGGSFTCKNKKCIAIRWKCDHDDDCGDGSDEDPLQCPAKSCKSTQFSCSNKRCIKSTWKCDGEDDCGDNSDEHPSVCNKTSSHVCKQGEIPCRSSNTGVIGQCILRHWRCDGEEDCSDGSDEEGCTIKPRCKANEFNCSSGICIDISKKCDMKKDCPAGDDELGCALRCREDEFKCKKSNKCIPKSKVCDWVNDCLEREDEPMICHINECVSDNGHCSQICIDEKIGYKCACRRGFELDTDQRTCKDINECMIPGSCSQKCENTKGSFKCSCLPSYILKNNHRSCKAIGQKPYLIFSDRQSLRSLTTEGMQGIASGLDGVIGISFDAAEETVYWADINERAIRSAALSNSHVINTVARLKNRSVPDGVAVDWIARKLYWSDAGLDLIEVSELDGSSSLVLVHSGLDEPRAIALDPMPGGRHIYWTDWGEYAKIEKMSMDGDASTRIILHNITGSWPNGLTIDFTQLRIYWTDAKLKVIESSKMDGNDRRVVTRVPDQHPFSISVFEDIMYWADWTNEAIYKANKFTGANRGFVIRNVYNVMGVFIYHPVRQPTASNPCGLYNGGCSHLCLLSSKYAYTCRCPTGVNMLDGGQICNTTSAYLCTPSYCLNGGECINSTVDKYAIRRCRCTRGYGGKRCEQRLNVHTWTKKPDTSSTLTSQLKNDNKEEDLATTIGMATGVALAIFLISGISIYIFYRHLRKNYRARKAVNFDNPVYRRTTEDSLPIMESTYNDNQL